jgi:cell division protein FtsI/penicillin-binding protein 2
MNRTEAELQPLPPVATTVIRTRMIVIAVGLGLALLVATGRAVMLQTVEGPVMRREAAKNYMRTETLDDWRGDIVDRNGRLLAVTVHRWALTVDPKKIADPLHTARVLAPVTGMTEGEILQKIDPMSTDLDEDAQVNPASALARELTSPMVRSLAQGFGIQRNHFDRRLDIIERFFQLEQLRSPAIFPLVDELAQAAENTATALMADVDKLRFVPTRGRRFAYVAHGLDDSAVKLLADARDEEARRCRAAREVGEPCKNALSAVFSKPETRRYYPKRELAAQVVGLVGRDDKGLSGIESAMNAFLSGGLHRVSAIKDVRGHRFFLDGIPSDATLVGNTVELALDQQIQAWAEQELSRACLASGARAGYVVVTRPKTGEVLAVANFPNYNPNTFQDWFREQLPLKNERAALAQRRSDLAWAAGFKVSQKAFGARAESTRKEIATGLDQEIDAFVEFQHTHPNASRNMAMLDVYEPGSIMKVFTAAAALEEKVVDLDTVFDLENGDWEIDDVEGNVIHDIARLEEGNLGLILKKSSNIGASKIAFLLGAPKLEEYLRGFGFGAPTRSGFPGEPKGLLRPSESWVPVELANVSFGQGMAVSGIQLAMALGALANEGKLMQPLLVKRVLDGEGRIVKEWEPTEVRQVVSPATARTTLDLMATVVEPDGTGRRAFIPEWPVAGKTGTGQKPHLRRRGYSEEMWVNTFFGVAPVDNPELAIVILIDEPKGKRHGGGLIAAPAFRRIMEKSLAYLGVASPYSTSKRQVWLDPKALADRRAVENEPPSVDPLESLAPLVAASDGLVPVPDFKGLTMSAAARLAARAGLVVRFEGQGIASSQSVKPDELVSATDGIIVYFASRLPDARTRSGEATPVLPGGPDLGPEGPPLPPQGDETSELGSDVPPADAPPEPFVRGQGGAP